MNCINCNPDPSGKKQCEILMRTLIHHANEPEYPTEWTYDKDGRPTCTAHKLWDWQTQGDPDDPANVNYQQPKDPNQLEINL